MLKKILCFFLTVVVLCVPAALLTGCQSGQEAPFVFPAQEDLVKNLEEAGYTVTVYDDIYGLEADGQRVYAEKGDKYIDICYGLSALDAESVFSFYEEKYLNTDYYILALNENFVYCVTDKDTFQKAGFTSTFNVGTQYIRE